MKAMLPPIIDPRDLSALVRQMKEMSPYYTPEWRFSPDDPDPGTALFLIFAEMFHENIKRFNRVPIKNFIAFLNMIDVSVLPARSARTFVTFRLSTGAREPVFIAAGTQISANVPESGRTVIFETEKNLLITPASLVDAYNANPVQDTILRIPEEFFEDPRKGDKPQAVLFDYSSSENLQEHSMYLGHADLFNIKDTALVELEVKNSLKHYQEFSICEKLADQEQVKWMYQGESGWYPFEDVSSYGNRLLLKKSKPMLIDKKEMKGLASRWIGCRVKNKIDGVNDIEIDSIGIRVGFYGGESRWGVAPDMVCYNDIQLDAQGFYPFGKYFALYDTFYLSNQEVFSKKGALVTIRFDFQHEANKLITSPVELDWKLIMKKKDFEEPKPLESSVLVVIWEYWNGSGWVRLFINKGYEEVFSHPAEDGEIKISFKCPKDIQEVFVKDHLNYWIRVRVISVENVYASNPVYRSPWIENIELKYEFSDSGQPPDHYFTYNNMDYQSRTENVRGNRNLFRPFYSMGCSHQAFYMGFDSPPLKGPVSIFFSTKLQKYAKAPPMVEWEYLRKNSVNVEWTTLKVADETNAFTRSGVVVFVGPQDFVRCSLFSKDLYWIRAVNRDGKFGKGDEGIPLPVMNGIYLNTTCAVQQESVKDELLEAAGGEAGKEYVLSFFPVTYEEVLVDEVGSLTEDEKRFLVMSGLADSNITSYDGWGKKEFWVRWSPVDDFMESGTDDRHYVIDRASGKICFGDGIYGKIPPSAGTDNIRVKYKFGGGITGNVDSFEVDTLQNSIAFVEEVYNPVPAGGGCDTETVEDALHRGPQVLKHRNRAVTATDFEWLAGQASQTIVKVKCLPNINGQGKKETGCVTVVIVPKDGQAGSMIFPELKRQVERFLLERTAGTLAWPEKIQVIEPAYLEICVYAELAVNEIDIVIMTEKEAVDRLNNFLNPMTGNYNGKGWEIGQHPHISIFYALLTSIKAVNHVKKVSMTVYKIEDGIKTEVDNDRLAELPHGMVVNGKHRVIINVL